ncbi:unnamed protein product [Lasius platythorax]|uniref:Uncharacterized protein n=1 Tax=Lasius platythorax TaxID=488582 RepID=A0AAV2MYV5_9HYME
MSEEVEEEREGFYRQNGFSSEGIKQLREGDMDVCEIIRGREKERLGQWMEGKIRNSKYNIQYKEITTLGLPEYLRKKERKGSQKLIARWRCGNEEEKNKYWK